ncbi:DUF5719 family protein [Microbacterium sp. BWT-B31]|uniref:DUF5719 family protein n=1 Tax=Microbacterium sp. BWT-B31 TaxID=3232072 RepID=UPI003528978D
MSDRRIFRWATTGARAFAGTVAVAAFVFAVVTAIGVPWPTHSREALSVEAMPVPAASVLACGGGILGLGQVVEDADQMVLVSPQTVRAGAGVDGAPLTDWVLEGPAQAGAFSAEPVGSDRTPIAASGSATASTSFLRGFAASACRPPLTESWLVAGSGATGAADVVLLGNPSPVPAMVELTVYGAQGPVVPPGGANLVVAPGSQRAIPLAGLAFGETSPVVRVSARGAAVTATLQTSITRTLATGGVDTVGAVASAQPTLIIAGVSVSSAAAAATGDAATVARVLAPTADGTASIQVTAVRGAGPAREAISAPLRAGYPVEVDLSGLEVGEYVVEVVADVPVVAAVWQTTGFGTGADFAWYTPAPEVSAPTVLALPPGPQPTLTLVNTGDADLVVAYGGLDEASEVTVPAQSTTSVRLRGQGIVRLDPSAPVHAGVSLTGDGALAGFPVWPDDAASRPITVYP